MAERRLGVGRKASARRRVVWEGGGRTSAASARLMWSLPSTAAMRTSGLAIDARRGALSLLDTGAAEAAAATGSGGPAAPPPPACPWPLCRAQR